MSVGTCLFGNICVDCFVVFRHRLPLDQWWLKLRPLIKVLAKHKSHRFEGERYQQERDGPETESEESMDLM